MKKEMRVKRKRGPRIECRSGRSSRSSRGVLINKVAEVVSLGKKKKLLSIEDIKENKKTKKNVASPSPSALLLLSSSFPRKKQTAGSVRTAHRTTARQAASSVSASGAPAARARGRAAAAVGRAGARGGGGASRAAVSSSSSSFSAPARAASQVAGGGVAAPCRTFVTVARAAPVASFSCSCPAAISHAAAAHAATFALPTSFVATSAASAFVAAYSPSCFSSFTPSACVAGGGSPVAAGAAPIDNRRRKRRLTTTEKTAKDLQHRGTGSGTGTGSGSGTGSGTGTSSTSPSTRRDIPGLYTVSEDMYDTCGDINRSEQAVVEDELSRCCLPRFAVKRRRSVSDKMFSPPFSSSKRKERFKLQKNISSSSSPLLASSSLSASKSKRKKFGSTDTRSPSLLSAAEERALSDILIDVTLPYEQQAQAEEKGKAEEEAETEEEKEEEEEEEVEEKEDTNNSNKRNTNNTNKNTTTKKDTSTNKNTTTKKNTNNTNKKITNNTNKNACDTNKNTTYKKNTSTKNNSSNSNTLDDVDENNNNNLGTLQLYNHSSSFLSSTTPATSSSSSTRTGTRPRTRYAVEMGSREKEEEENGSYREASFACLGVCEELLASVNSLGWSSPTPIQKAVIPLALKKKDIVALAETGSGKTAAFALPILQQLLEHYSEHHFKPQRNVYSLILAPTRELSLQITQHFLALGSIIGCTVATIVGGLDHQSQALALAKKPNVVVGTPGRVLDHLQQTKGFSLKAVKVLVLDEADRLLSLDFDATLQELLQHVGDVDGGERQTMLFSATMTTKVSKLQRTSLRNPVKVEVNSKYDVAKHLQQQFILAPARLKHTHLAAALLHLSPSSVIIFTNTCMNARKTALFLRHLGIKTVCLHGKMTQPQRIGALTKFRAADATCLVATEVGSRGLDIPQVDMVINFDVPLSSKEYIHRVGRTARAGRSGRALTIVTQYDVDAYQRIEHALGKKLEEMAELTTPEKVMPLHEKVLEALRSAELESREADETLLVQKAAKARRKKK